MSLLQHILTFFNIVTNILMFFLIENGVSTNADNINVQLHVGLRFIRICTTLFFVCLFRTWSHHQNLATRSSFADVAGACTMTVLGMRIPEPEIRHIDLKTLFTQGYELKMVLLV